MARILVGLTACSLLPTTGWGHRTFEGLRATLPSPTGSLIHFRISNIGLGNGMKLRILLAAAAISAALAPGVASASIVDLIFSTTYNGSVVHNGEVLSGTIR